MAALGKCLVCLVLKPGLLEDYNRSCRFFGTFELNIGTKEFVIIYAASFEL